MLPLYHQVTVEALLRFVDVTNLNIHAAKLEPEQLMFEYEMKHLRHFKTIIFCPQCSNPIIRKEKITRSAVNSYRVRCLSCDIGHYNIKGGRIQLQNKKNK